MSPRKGGASQDSGWAPPSRRRVTEAWGGGPSGETPNPFRPLAPRRVARRWGPDPRSPGRGRGRFVWAQGASAEPTEPGRSPRASTPHPQAQPQPLPLGRRFTTSQKTPLSVCKAPGLPGDAHPFTTTPPPPAESFSDNRARLKVQATPSQCEGPHTVRGPPPRIAHLEIYWGITTIPHMPLWLFHSLQSPSTTSVLIFYQRTASSVQISRRFVHLNSHYLGKSRNIRKWSALSLVCVCVRARVHTF